MKLGFIGCGNMAGAIIGGIIKHNVCKKEEIIGSDPLEAGRKRVQENHGIQVTADNTEVVREADIVFLAVKPQYYEGVLDEIRDSVKVGQIFISIAPGKTIAWIGEHLGETVKLVRTMPNTPALVGEGMTAACANTYVTEEEMEQVLQILSATGKVEVVPEHLMDVVVGVSGSSPAYVFMFIEAMADAAVAEGMPRDQAYRFAAQSVLGSAKMVLETGKHPGELKDMVCSPGGTTIAAVQELERTGFRSSIMEAMKVCADK
ncbi:MAG: pyrroline-5-carboxylate reductase, partial [Lachnospiraceae bacterium]|nr:pyrroline-5-carboxylate reductase [Lachnospiraceae bacterium]